MKRTRIIGAVAAVAVVAALAGKALAQTPASAVPLFDVASIKLNKSGSGISGGRTGGGRFTATNVSARMLIQQGYARLQDFQIVSGPDWAAVDRFDVAAKGSDDLTTPAGLQSPAASNDPTPMQLAIRALLADRFKLVVHHETRELPIYALVLARADGKLGASLHRSTEDCAALAEARGRGDAPAPAPPALNERPACGMRSGPGVLGFGGRTLTDFVSTLSAEIGRTVLDRTGLTGPFDIDLTWTPDQMPQRASGASADQPTTVFGITIDLNGASLFTAIQEQLGLKLESARGPVDVLVIDHVERPTDN